MDAIIDLSHPISDGLITYPGLPAAVIGDHLTREESRTHYAPGYEFHIGRIEMVSNTGTYLDTPFHRFTDGVDLAGLELARVVNVPGVLVDATATAEAGAVLLDGLDLGGHAVLFRAGWDRHWGTEAYGSGDHPYVGMDAVERLVTAEAALVGIDSLNIDDTRGGERPVHTALLGAGIPSSTSPACSVSSAPRSRSVPPRRRSSGWGPSPSAPWPSWRPPRATPDGSIGSIESGAGVTLDATSVVAPRRSPGHAARAA